MVERVLGSGVICAAVAVFLGMTTIVSCGSDGRDAFTDKSLGDPGE